MGKIISRVPDVMEKLGLTQMDLVRRGVVIRSAYRAARGEVRFSLETVAKICDALKVSSLSELFEYVPDGSGVGQDHEQDHTQASNGPEGNSEHARQVA